MSGNLVIVESPAKAKTIEKFLGKDYKVVSSFGHIRDLAKKNIGIDIENGFAPDYIIPDEKKKVVAALKKEAKEAKIVWLASDEDREGEAIAWHLTEVLDLKPENVRRIVFHEITKEAIEKAIKNPRQVNLNLVNAQQARRVLDRLVGFEISPILWKKVQPSLSAGRVQSVAVRLLVDREREIISFNSESSFRVTGEFTFTGETGDEGLLKAESTTRFAGEEQALEFVKKCVDAKFTIEDVQVKPGTRSPAPPFTTSTLQQEAFRKLGFSVAQTMSVAQKLYEAGKITYMRTDSTNLSQSAIATATRVIGSEFGDRYSRPRQYKTKSKGAQEAHEAIRPAYMENRETTGSNQEKRLYDLIWKRTLASQMSNAEIERTTISIGMTGSPNGFAAHGEVVKFDGFLKVYRESTDSNGDHAEEGVIPPVKKGMPLGYVTITATERFTTPPPRYTEASLVKKMEELGIGRPSTYAPVISTILNRGYVERGDRPGEKRKVREIILTGGNINHASRTEMAGREKGKLFPQDIGMIVNDFLVQNFSGVLDYNFTAAIERDFDLIAEGERNWTAMLEQFYSPFHKKVTETLEQSERHTGEKLLGKHPETGEPVYVKMGRYGPVAQIGDSSDDQKPRFASLLNDQLIETITLKEALELFRLPRVTGSYEGADLTVGIGKFGPYIRHNNKFYSLKKGVDDPMTITEERAIELIEEKRETERNRIIRTFGDIQILNGRYGPYISYDKTNFRIPKNSDPEKLTEEECREIIAKGNGTGRKGRSGAGKGTAAAKKGSTTAGKGSAAAGKGTTAAKKGSTTAGKGSATAGKGTTTAKKSSTAGNKSKK
ncbi:MAG: type I DNA topoisomerase [Bacteroidales bacterium]|nr:type I DNA topoisomerase [Bacteroidales bacterium]